MAQPRQQPPPPAPQDQRLRPAYLVNPRMRRATNLAIACAFLLLLGVFGGVIVELEGGGDSVFDLAKKHRFAPVRPGIGYLVGPVLILLTMSTLIGPAGSVYKVRTYVARMVIATVLWALGLLVWISATAYFLLEDYEVRAGTYVALGLLVGGLLATIAMWPFGGRPVHIDETGKLVGERAETRAASDLGDHRNSA